MDILFFQNKYNPKIGDWHIVRHIGSGSFGKVFEINREEYGRVYKAALKIITIPQSEEQRKSIISSLDLTEENANTYFQEMVNDLAKEISVMAELQGNSNIVSYLDHQVIYYKDKAQWDILIRMELLTPFGEYSKSHDINEEIVAKLGKDICNALITCKQKNIIHRDIKPENIFVTKEGNFKLGDFGVARTIEKTTGASTKVGTYDYMSPEVYQGKNNYDFRTDIYSLGLVMYRLLNGNKLPFLPTDSQSIGYSEVQAARNKRFEGEKLPEPAFASSEMSKVILKACTYNVKDRYASPEEMLLSLESVTGGKGKGTAKGSRIGKKELGIIAFAFLIIFGVVMLFVYKKNNWGKSLKRENSIVSDDYAENDYEIREESLSEEEKELESFTLKSEILELIDMDYGQLQDKYGIEGEYEGGSVYYASVDGLGVTVAFYYDDRGDLSWLDSENPIPPMNRSDKVEIIMTTAGNIVGKEIPKDVRIKEFADKMEIPNVKNTGDKHVEVLNSGGSRYYVSGETFAQIELTPKDYNENMALYMQVDLDNGDTIATNTSVWIDRRKYTNWELEEDTNEEITMQSDDTEDLPKKENYIEVLGVDGYVVDDEDKANLVSLFEEYLESMVSGDSDKVISISEGTTPTEEIYAIEEYAPYYEYIESPRIFVAKGYTEHSYVVLLRYSLKLRGADTLLPELEDFYVSQDDSGNLYLKNSHFEKEEREYYRSMVADDYNEGDPHIENWDQIDNLSDYIQAVESDQVLSDICTSMCNSADKKIEERMQERYGINNEKKLKVTKVVASSTLAAKSVDNSTYEAGNLVDGDHRTAWCEGADGVGEGEELILHLDGIHKISRIVIYNGFLKTKRRYAINGKLKEIEINFDNIHIEDYLVNYITPAEEDVEFSESLLNPTEITAPLGCETDTIVITIKKALEGSQYTDTAVSEIEVYGE